MFGHPPQHSTLQGCVYDRDPTNTCITRQCGDATHPKFGHQPRHLDPLLNFFVSQFPTAMMPLPRTGRRLCQNRWMRRGYTNSGRAAWRCRPFRRLHVHRTVSRLRVDTVIILRPRRNTQIVGPSGSCRRAHAQGRRQCQADHIKSIPCACRRNAALLQNCAPTKHSYDVEQASTQASSVPSRRTATCASRIALNLAAWSRGSRLAFSPQVLLFDAPSSRRAGCVNVRF